MGLGKTVQIIALMLSNPPYIPARKSTLVVAPLAVIAQWRNELRSKAPGRFSVCIYHGGSRTKDKAVLGKFDVVITTYATLAAELARADKLGDAGGHKKANGPLFGLYW